MPGMGFYAMSGIKFLANLMHAITCPTSANESSNIKQQEFAKSSIQYLFLKLNNYPTSNI